MLECIKGNNTVWTSEISYDAFFCCSLGTSYSHARTVAHAQTLWLSSHYVRVLAKGDTRSVRTPSGSASASASAIACLYGSHSGWIHTKREREHREWTHSFRSIETVCFEPTTIVQLINDFQNQYRIRIRAVRFYIFIHSLRLRHCLDICARAQRTTTTTTTISTTHSTVISTTRAQQTSSSSSISTQQSNLSNTVDFVTVTPFAIASLLFLCFASSFFLLWLYIVSRVTLRLLFVCVLLPIDNFCVHTHTHITPSKSHDMNQLASLSC